VKFIFINFYICIHINIYYIENAIKIIFNMKISKICIILDYMMYFNIINM